MDLWLADPEAAGFARLADEVLAPQERARAERFTHRHAKAVYRGARALVRQTLSRYSETPASDWRFAEGELGKPHVAAPPSPLAFNLSHTRGLAAVAVAGGGRVGCDVEHTGRRGRLDAIARRFFTAAELATFAGLDEAAKRSRFFDIWTLKEAYTKARGLGLHLPTTSYAVLRGDDDALTVQVAPEADEPTPEIWAFHLTQIGAHHRLALAVDEPIERVRTFWASPDGGFVAD